jgi:hypothetical protein
MDSLGESAFMRRVQVLVSGCCYCGSLYHDTTNCPWRPPMSEQNNTDEMSSPLPGGECDYSTLSHEQLVEAMIRNGKRADELQRIVFLRGEDLTHLRARLAKYEDAEGRPVVVVPEQAKGALEWIDDFIARCNGDDRGSCDSVNVLRTTMESQAREIERLTQYIEQQDDAYALLSLDAGRKMDELEQQLAALKAQPSGVVLPELPAPWQCETAMCPNLYTAEQMIEFARLNSSPVSTACTVERPCIPCFSGSGKCAGGAGERAAFEARFPLHDMSKRQDDDGDVVYLDDWTQGAFIGWQARAALSAPSHGEQVREVPSVQITGHLDEVDAPVWEFISAEARKLGPITGSIDSYGLSRPNGGQPNGGVAVLWNGPKIHAVALAVRDAMNRTVCIRLLAAAPSAGSQEQG